MSLTLLPRALAAFALVAMMLQLGLEAEPHEDRAQRRRRRRLMLRALVVGFVIVPLCAALVARATGAKGPLATALLILAAAAGGRWAPLLTRASRGDVGLSVEIALWSNKLNPILTPFIAAWLIGAEHVGVRELTYAAQLLGLQLAPYYLARRLAQRRPRLATRLVRPVEIAMLAASVALLAYLMAHQGLREAARALGVRGIAATIAFGLTVAGIGWLVGTAGTRSAFALSTEMRNLELALVVANLTQPEAVQLATFAAWLILFALGWLFAWLLRRYHTTVGRTTTGAGATTGAATTGAATAP